MKTFLVGGAVRDLLLNIPSKDQDWVVIGATPSKMLAQGFKQVGADFPVFLHPETQEEYALGRTERKTGKGYGGFTTDFSPDVSLEEDLERRDLTINAMAQDDNGQLIDPYDGKKDLENKILRHVSDAFSEDPLRVLRLARFYARFKHLGFLVAEDTLILCKAIAASGELDHLTSERVWQETHRALSEKSPSAYFELLRQVDALAILFPELDKLFGVPQPEVHHPEIDCGIHALLCLEQAKRLSEHPEVWYAALTHDLGKGLTPESEWPKHHGHELKGIKPLKAMNKRLKIPREFHDLSLLTCEFHTHIHKAFELRPQTVLKVLKKCDAFRRPERFERLLLAAKADSRGRTGFEDIPYHQMELFLAYYAATKQVDMKALRASGLEGKALGEAIDQARVNAISKVDRETYQLSE